MPSLPAETYSAPPATTSSSVPAKKYYMDPERVYKAVGRLVKPTNPLLQYIPTCKNIDEFNEFTKTETYRKLMDYRNPIVEPKMDPEFRQSYQKLLKQRKQMIDFKDYPVYTRLPYQRFWYRFSWTMTVIGLLIGSYNGYHLVKNY